MKEHSTVRDVRALCALLIVTTAALPFLLTVVWPVRQCAAAWPEEKLMRWYAPDSTWGVGGFRLFDRASLARQIERRPEKVVGWQAFERIAQEEGDWLAFRVGLKKVGRVIFTARTRIVLKDRMGRELESENILFWPDRWQTSVYDAAASPVVVSRNSVWCGDDGGGACGAAKFHAASVRLGDIVGFEVVGAIVQDRDGRAD